LPGSKEGVETPTLPTHVKPQLKGTTPNQVWSWDITKLLGPKKWISIDLYVVIDIYRR
jgi:putative transposase